MLRMIRKARVCRGFSLIEASIALIIIGLLATTALETYRKYLNEKFKTDTETRVKTVIYNAMVAFVMKNKRYPCPADPGLDPGHSLAGMEACTLSSNANGACTSTAIYNNGGGKLCRAAGFRNVDGSGGNESVLIGSIPYATLGVSLADSVDPWNNKFTYAVSETITKLNVPGTTFGYLAGQARGVIRLMSKSVNPTTGVVSGLFNDPGGPAGQDSYDFVIFSHGPDGKGAYTFQGRQRSACTGADLDVEDCDFDATFINAERSTGIQSRSRVPVSGVVPFFDDLETLTAIVTEEDKWIYTSASSISTKTTGFVGIGTQTPTTQLHVAGNVKAGQSVAPATTRDVLADQFCSPDGSCFPAQLIGGSGVNCGTGATSGLATGFEDNNVLCAMAVNPVSIVAGTCPGDGLLTGFDASGNIICQTP